MSKVIVFLADGTWNGIGVDSDRDGVPEATNVLKLYHNLAGDESIDSFSLENESERVAMNADRNILQIAKYLHGVGDSDNPLRKMLTGAFGAGVISRIVRGYTFISRNYAPGDRIIIIGFSRGAYTARARRHDRKEWFAGLQRAQHHNQGRSLSIRALYLGKLP